MSVKDGGYVPHLATMDDWNAAGGLFCPRCRREVARLATERNICLQCLNDKRRLVAHKSRLSELRDAAQRSKRGC